MPLVYFIFSLLPFYFLDLFLYDVFPFLMFPLPDTKLSYIYICILEMISPNPRFWCLAMMDSLFLVLVCPCKGILPVWFIKNRNSFSHSWNLVCCYHSAAVWHSALDYQFDISSEPLTYAHFHGGWQLQEVDIDWHLVGDFFSASLRDRRARDGMRTVGPNIRTEEAGLTLLGPLLAALISSSGPEHFPPALSPIIVAFGIMSGETVWGHTLTRVSLLKYSKSPWIPALNDDLLPYFTYFTNYPVTQEIYSRCDDDDCLIMTA